MEQVLRNFLWKGSDLSHGGAKVAWASICLPKQEGGLGITNFEVWNLAAMLKHIWHICSDGDQSIWSNWVRSYLIRHRYFWEMRRPGVCSWAWGKLWKLREVARGNLKREGNRVLWTETPNGIFSIKSAWESVRTRGPRVDWHKVVWFSKRIPRHAVILWLAIRRKLSTRDILASIGLSRDTRCVLCGNEGESHDHLFFSCPFSEGIWRLLCSKCNLPWSNLDWGETIQWKVSNLKGKSLLSLIVKLMLAAAVYSLWRERGFFGGIRNVSNLFSDILVVQGKLTFRFPAFYS